LFNISEFTHDQTNLLLFTGGYVYGVQIRAYACMHTYILSGGARLGSPQLDQ